MSHRISVTGLGYVGLPVAVSMSRKFPTIGFDVNELRVKQLKEGVDVTKEVESRDLKDNPITFTTQWEDLKGCNFHIVAVPTPVDEAHVPDMSMVFAASRTVAKALKPGDIVVYESTVYPGATEDECVPILEEVSGLKYQKDFFVGYSPERINPGDKEHTFEKITKVVSGSTPEALKTVSEVYGAVVTAGVHPASSIKVAEAAKVIENIQRDLNVALINEFALVFDRLKIDTLDVIEAASTKWNFLKFKPGLVGGHCIGVDPYYLTYRAEKAGYHTQVILAGRNTNDSMGGFVAQKTVKTMLSSGGGNKVHILGFTFKEDCPDFRNTKVIDIYNELKKYGLDVKVTDPEADPQEVREEYGVEIVPESELGTADALILAVGHKDYKNKSVADFEKWVAPKGVIFDVKGVLDRETFASHFQLVRL